MYIFLGFSWFEADPSLFTVGLDPTTEVRIISDHHLCSDYFLP